MKTTQPRSNRRKGLTTRLKGQRSPEEDNTITRTKDTKTRRHGTDATKIIDNNQITRRTIFEVKKCFQGHEMWLSIMSPMWRHTHVSGYFLIRNFFFLQIRFLSTRIRWIRPAYESATLQSGNFWIRSECENLWRLDPEFFHPVM